MEDSTRTRRSRTNTSRQLGIDCFATFYSARSSQLSARVRFRFDYGASLRVIETVPRRLDRAGKRPVINFLRTGVTASSEPRLDEEVASRENNQLMEERAQSFAPAATSQRSTEGAIYYSSYFSTAHPLPPSVSVSAGYFDRADNVNGETGENILYSTLHFRFAVFPRRIHKYAPVLISDIYLCRVVRPRARPSCIYYVART